jgi:hypothetical protein
MVEIYGDQVFRIHIIYQADGMRRPLSSRQDVPASSCAEAVQLAINFIRSAYVSGFEVLTWTAENLSRPVHLKYVSGALAREVEGKL